MSLNKTRGNLGEQDVIEKVMCPNCSKKLMLLPVNYPLYDVQCTACNFRAQVKTNHSSPKKEIFGAGWDIMEKVLKSGFLVPPLIVNFFWQEDQKQKQEIRFYPFIPRKFLKKRKLSEHSRRAGYTMFNYTNLDRIPFISIYEE